MTDPGQAAGDPDTAPLQPRPTQGRPLVGLGGDLRRPWRQTRAPRPELVGKAWWSRSGPRQVRGCESRTGGWRGGGRAGSGGPAPPCSARLSAGAVVRAADAAAACEALGGGAHGPLVLQAVVHGERAGPGGGAGRGRGPADPSPCLAQNNKVRPDLNVLQVWSQGLSGRGIVISVLDDGIEKDHPDLWANYVRPWGLGWGLRQVLRPAPVPHVPARPPGPPGQLRLQ